MGAAKRASYQQVVFIKINNEAFATLDKLGVVIRRIWLAIRPYDDAYARWKQSGERWLPLRDLLERNRMVRLRVEKKIVDKLEQVIKISKELWLQKSIFGIGKIKFEGKKVRTHDGVPLL